MRSPSSAPPLRRRVGSIATTAICALREVPHQARQQLVGQARLARAAGAGDADDRHLVPRARQRPADLLRLRVARSPSAPSSTEMVRAIRPWSRALSGPELVGGLAHRGDAREHVVDHAGQAHAAAVLGRVDLLHAVALERLDLVRARWCRRRRPPRARAVAALAQHVDHVGEVLVVAALVGADGDGVGVLVDGGAHDVGDAAVVAEVHHLGAARLQQAPDHVDGGVVTVEQRGGGHEAQRPCQRLRAHACSAAPRSSPAFMCSLPADDVAARLPGAHLYPRVGYLTHEYDRVLATAVNAPAPPAAVAGGHARTAIILLSHEPAAVPARQPRASHRRRPAPPPGGRAASGCATASSSAMR